MNGILQLWPDVDPVLGPEIFPCQLAVRFPLNTDTHLFRNRSDAIDELINLGLAYPDRSGEVGLRHTGHLEVMFYRVHGLILALLVAVINSLASCAD